MISKLCLRELLVCAPQDQKCPCSPSIGACTDVSTSKLCLRELLVCAPQDQKCPCSPYGTIEIKFERQNCKVKIGTIMGKKKGEKNSLQVWKE
jgi:hypothetical protein